HVRVMFGSELAGQAAYPELTATGSAAFAVLLDAIEACQRDGLMRAVPSRDLALSAWSLVHGLAMLLVDGQLPGGPTQAEALARMVTETLQSGMITDEARHREGV